MLMRLLVIEGLVATCWFYLRTPVVIVSASSPPTVGTAGIIARLNTRGEYLRVDVTRPAAERVRVTGCVHVLKTELHVYSQCRTGLIVLIRSQ